MARVVLFFVCTIPFWGGLWLATQHFAQTVEYNIFFLGEPLLGSGPSSIYLPWKIFTWYQQYHIYAPGLFSTFPIYLMGGLFLTILLLFFCKPKEQLTSHGTAHWATHSDVKNMELIASSGIVIGMYDGPFKQKLYALLKYLEHKKTESNNMAEIAWNERRDKRVDREMKRAAKLDIELAALPDRAPQRKPLLKALAKAQAFIKDPPSYQASPWSLPGIYSRLFKSYASWYAQLSHTYLRDNSNRHVAVVAPTRSGKGVGLIVPTLLGGWRESVIVNDIKSENWGITAGYRKRMGQTVIKFEPTSDDGSSARWNPLDEIHIGTPTEVSMAQNLGAVLANYEGKKNADHWIANAGNVIFAVILHLKYAHYADPDHYPHEPNLYSVASFLKSAAAPTVDEDGTIDPDEISVQDFVSAIQGLQNYDHVPPGGIDITEWDTDQGAYVQRHFDPKDLWAMYPDDFPNGAESEAPYTHPIINKAFIEIAKKPDNELGSIVSTANTALKEYLDPVLTSNTRVSDFCIDDVMNAKKPVSLYLITPPSDLLRLAPIFRLFFEMMVRHHTVKLGEYKAGRCKNVYKHRCLFLMDEFAALGNLQSFAGTLAYIAGYGMKAFLIMQGLPQLFEVYGKDNLILMNCGLQIYYSPNENDTAQYVEKMLGNETILVKSTSESGFMKKNYSYSATARPLMTGDEAKRLGDEEIILVQDKPPVKTEKIKYYQQGYFLSKLRDAPYVSDVIRSGPTAKEINQNPKRQARIAAKKAAVLKPLS